MLIIAAPVTPGGSARAALRRLAGETCAARGAIRQPRAVRAAAPAHLPRWQAGIEPHHPGGGDAGGGEGLGISFISRLAVADRLALGGAWWPSPRVAASPPALPRLAQAEVPLRRPAPLSWPSAAPRPWRENPSDTTRGAIGAPLSFSR